MIDSHCHIDLPEFDHDRAEVLKQALSLGVKRILVPGLDERQVKRILAMKHRYAMLDIAAGFHPYFIKEMPTEKWHVALDNMSTWIDNNLHELVAIGEFGLDGTLALSSDFQERVFIDQLCLAQQFKKPVVLHHRQSHNEIIRLLKKQKFRLGGVIHAFSGSAQIAHSYIEMGFKLGIGGTITYERGAKTRRALTSLPLSALLLETDAPDMPIFGYQGQRNTPERLGLIAKALAQVKQCSLGNIIEQTTANYMSLFSSISAP